MNSVSIHARYTFPSNDQEEPLVVEKTFDESNCEIARLGLPEGVEAVKPQGGDYSFSGMHDHGPLPLPKEGGDFAKLIGMVNEARKHSDELLTKLIEEQNEAAREKRKKGKISENKTSGGSKSIKEEGEKRQKTMPKE